MAARSKTRKRLCFIHTKRAVILSSKMASKIATHTHPPVDCSLRSPLFLFTWLVNIHRVFIFGSKLPPPPPPELKELPSVHLNIKGKQKLCGTKLSTADKPTVFAFLANPEHDTQRNQVNLNDVKRAGWTTSTSRPFQALFDLPQFDCVCVFNLVALIAQPGRPN